MKSKISKIKRELLILGICLIAGIVLNIWSITNYDDVVGKFMEQLHIALLFGIAIYILLLIFRLIFLGIFQIINKK